MWYSLAMKILRIFILLGILTALIIPFLRFTPLEPSIPPSPTPTQTVKKAACQAITVKNPLPDQKVNPPQLTVTVVINNTNPLCHWTISQGNAGTLELQDENQNTLATGKLTTTQDWTENKPITYEGSIPVNTVGTGIANLIITEENPMGQDNPQTISIPLIF